MALEKHLKKENNMQTLKDLAFWLILIIGAFFVVPVVAMAVVFALAVIVGIAILALPVLVSLLLLKKLI